MVKHERNARAIVRAALANGWKISVNDGEEWTVKASTNYREITSAMFSTDEEILRFRDKDGARIGSVYLFYCNQPYEIIADCTDNPTMDAFLNPLQERFDAAA